MEIGNYQLQTPQIHYQDQHDRSETHPRRADGNDVYHSVGKWPFPADNGPKKVLKYTGFRDAGRAVAREESYASIVTMQKASYLLLCSWLH